MASFSYRSALVSTTSALALALTSSVTAYAQDGQQAQSVVGLESITVTARRVEENIQRVPIAVQAFTPETLENQDVRDIWSLTKNIGGLNICCSPGNTSFTFMRGISNGTPTYFADVPSRSSGFANFFDIGNVQVLKGPQGTLFGEASNAGAIVYTPNKPGDFFGGYVEASAGNYGRRSIEGAVDLPLVEDKLLSRVAVKSFHRDGYITDITTNKKYAEQSYYIIRPSLTWRINDNLESYTMFQLEKSWGNPSVYTLDDFNFMTLDNGAPALSITPTLAFLNSVVPYGDTGMGVGDGSVATWNQLRGQVLKEELDLGPYKFNGHSTSCATPLGPINNGGNCAANWERRFFFTNTTTWNITDDITLKNIFGWATMDSFSQPGDTDGTRLRILDSGHPLNTTPTDSGPSWSEEIQLIWNDLFDIVDLQVGTFHRHEHNEPQVTYGRTLGMVDNASITKTSERARAVYGQANVDLGMLLDGLTFTGGARYTWDWVKNQRWDLNPNTLAVTNVRGGPGSPAGVGKFTNLSYTAGFQWQYTPDIMFFITNARGFSQGGLQNVIGFESFQPDVLNNIEVGTKATFNIGDMQVRTNASYFYGWYDDVKVSVTRLVQSNPAPAPKSLTVVTENAAKATISGIDADITVLPTDWLEIGGVFAYTDATYTEWDTLQLNQNTGQFETISLASTPFSFTPKYKWTLRGTYHFPIDASWGDVSLSANLTWTDTMYNVAKPRVPTDPNNPTTGIICDRYRTAAFGYPDVVADGGKVRVVDCNPSYYNLDMNLNWNSINGIDGLDGTLFVTNVTKNVQNDGGCYCDGPLGVTSQAPQVPRMFGIKLKYAF